MRRQLVVMLKEPRPGRVKTRLGRDIGMTSAAWWFRHQTRQLLRRLEDPRWDLVLAVAPDREGLQSRVWPAHLPRVAQGRGDLGDRMARLMRTLPRGPVCIIGGDIPGVTRAHVRRAFRALGDHDAVFGPAPDGGYWLTGLKRVSPPPVTLFDKVRWSSEHALADSIASLGGLPVALTDRLDDVDTLADLTRGKAARA
ncbi:TIGR04282 family arsenosugar biosynthesis glycosyltransferase [Aestuariicoccus sp. MJ-SS9]|uniref:TIGR04282 family arsenosugar biosynthesis glycosyltransferase n=1 Tax=Aestuariicoccus sp. MJ-SS9 TaxID=3079855 RepID=UPI002912A7C6|nr:TIGR04282 family arsenosugar biosynthesis glycosyltransferase [Aestuariicoccus sp. MJ-SS9]MDU8910088.1 TIGR04282 family arsenosugar biosynthesis glycosyltransferase [Aestuariicoccus sp. MJ-SS9]